jgi:hypothetical protein
MTTEELIAYCEHFIKLKRNQLFAINAGFWDERQDQRGETRQDALDWANACIRDAQIVLEDAQSNALLFTCKVCIKPTSPRITSCIHCGHPYSTSSVS